MDSLQCKNCILPLLAYFQHWELPEEAMRNLCWFLCLDLLPCGSAGLKWEAVVMTGRCPTHAVLLLSRGCEQAPKLGMVLGIAKSNSLGITKEVSVLQKGIDLALGRCCLLTGSVSRCWDSSCGRKDAHLVFPGLELFFWLFLVPLCSVNVQLIAGGYNV